MTRGAAALLRLGLAAAHADAAGTLDSVAEGDVAAALHRDFPETSFLGFDRMCTDHAKLFASQWRKLASGYPRVAVRISTVKLAKVPVKKKGCLGATSYAVGQPMEITLSEKHFERSACAQTDDLILLNEAIRFGPPGAGTAAAVLSHEFGHAVYNVTLHEFGGPGAAEELNRLLPKTAGAEISGYAMTSSEELFAEAFSLLQHGDPRTRPAAVDGLRSYLERLYGREGSFKPFRGSGAQA